MALVRSRIAPTPSGFLHEGNAFNFLLTWALVRAYDGVLQLRIDDADEIRSKPEYIQNIFQDLEWLGIDWNSGPQSPDEQSAFSHPDNKERYRKTLRYLQEQDLVFPCDCSRKDLDGEYEYPGRCVENVPNTPPYSWRFLPKLAQRISLKNTQGNKVLFDIPYSMNQTVLWRKRDIPAYQLFSLVDDLDNATNLIVRGIDLLDSSLFQMHLSEFLPENDFKNARFLHHPLRKDRQGIKLSKSDGALSLQTLRETEKSPELLIQRFCRWMGWTTISGNIQELIPLMRAEFKWAEEVY